MGYQPTPFTTLTSLSEVRDFGSGVEETLPGVSRKRAQPVVTSSHSMLLLLRNDHTVTRPTDASDPCDGRIIATGDTI